MTTIHDNNEQLILLLHSVLPCPHLLHALAFIFLSITHPLKTGQDEQKHASVSITLDLVFLVRI
ncbi:uncharacterized protein LACBIDRAFT_298325 [Laccaria bicolor S238N-H82]|uniref:Predicted protein n=1 Tax=Laccaria bicolor (strain S238N-H82 / ATCC MYA-4686) TaxID=486041 RepID=B0E3A3_LACBS|nr:uncharacterized protein LACBIDRAFT_298325 [Laccaria bicolor S238N-H82]EDQ98681.1 predicted protein [Laccaria bicolor S238N-H82]|eukprot:XP_001890671.1 predicted protein [Laccaria bicolor S238N-H82]